MQKYISIITAHFNDFHRLCITMESIMNQPRNLFEWIVVDGLSNNIENKEREKIIKNADKFISEKDYGIGDAWNKGIKIAEGKYILLLNCGDTISKGLLTNLSWLDEKNPKIHSYHAVMTNMQYKPLKILRPIPENLYLKMSIPHNFTFVPLYFYKNFGCYKNLKISMDYEWFVRNFHKNKLVSKIVSHNFIAGLYPTGGLSDKFPFTGFFMNLKFQLNYLPKSYFFNCIINFLYYLLKHLTFKFWINIIK